MRINDWGHEHASRTAALIGVVLGVSAAFFIVVAKLSDPSPRIGDIVSFQPTDDRPDVVGGRLLVHRNGQFGCVLDLNVLRHSGGSLVVESQVTPDRGEYHLHWAGERTSADSANCGVDADLIVGRRDLVTLAAAAALSDLVWTDGAGH